MTDFRTSIKLSTGVWVVHKALESPVYGFITEHPKAALVELEAKP